MHAWKSQCTVISEDKGRLLDVSGDSFGEYQSIPNAYPGFFPLFEKE